jgi:NAD(P)-dependent dehydrogenase (short-subunit alcohol dehydrogenase family)
MKPCIVISGANSGIGLALCKQLANAGYVVIAGIRSENSKQNLAAMEMPNLFPVQLDLGSDQDIDELTEYLQSRPEWRLSGLVNNAGISLTNPIADCSRSEMQAVFDSNVFGHMQLSRALLPRLIRDSGRILHIGSTSSQVPGLLNGSYGGSKAALRMMSRILDLELAQTKVRSIYIKPGVVATPHWQKIAEREQEISVDTTLLPPSRGQYLSSLSTKGFNTPQAIALQLQKILESKTPFAEYTLGLDAKMRLLIFSLLPAGLHRCLTARRHK